MPDKIDYASVLNPAQLEAVTTLEGPVLVIAGAGSGKTRTLIYRVARLVETGVDPESILLLTFTRKASQEMLERAAGLADPRCRFVSGGTFHSLAHRVLRGHAERIGYDNAFIILDRSDMEEIIHSLVPELRMPKGTPRFPKRSTLANILSKAANLQVPLEPFMASEYAQFIEFVGPIETLDALYARYKKLNQMMDYDDLIINFRRLLEENEDIRHDLGLRYLYIMVDEYQDTNAIQADIVKWLGQGHRNVMAVGDDCQAIYSFRGADYRNMFEFPERFPNARVLKLEENYRSTQPILTFTNALMAPALEQYTKCLYTKREGGEPPKVVDTRTEPEQALYVARRIKDEMGRGRPITDFAVLFRAGYHSFELEAELTRQGMPYVKYGGFKFLESAHIKDFLAHLRVLASRDDAVSWVRILRLIKNVGRARTHAVIQWLKESRAPLQQVDQWPGAGKRLSGFKPLAELFSSLSAKGVTPKAAADQVMAYYVPFLEARFDDHPRRRKELDQLITMAGRYKKLRGFLDDLTLEPPASSKDLGAGDAGETLTLSTVHSAKGLEWPVVFIIWVMEGRFPPGHAFNDPMSLEEERRLMYVAATRAKDRLIMCYPGQEFVPSWSSCGSGAGHRNGLSSFIRGIPPDVLSHEAAGARFGETITEPWQGGHAGVRGGAEPGAGDLASGDRVRHPAFGPGVISRFIGDDKVEVFFRNAGRKLLHLEYTTLEKM
ncbi:MAG: DUF3553 domain-containing protein [Deltaproteobacteria bacterium]|nr:DUF3553 domain-containing protein [Deltaproteobacteria bacterium]